MFCHLPARLCCRACLEWRGNDSNIATFLVFVGLIFLSRQVSVEKKYFESAQPLHQAVIFVHGLLDHGLRPPGAYGA